MAVLFQKPGRRVGVWLVGLSLGVAGLVLGGCASPEADGAPHAGTTPPADLPADDEAVFFADRTAEVGLHFVHFNGMTGALYFPEPLGAGAALFDYDDDGDLDAYLVQGALFDDGTTVEDALFPPEGPLTDRLFRNDLVETGRLHFTDVTEVAGLAAPGYGMGVATGDYDNDGDVDLYVANFGPNQLWRNEGDGTFTDVTAEAGLAAPRWSAAATFFDYDGDGLLDLFVVNYVSFSLASHKPCSSQAGRRDYCGPLSYEPEQDLLFRNLGDGTFADVTGPAGLLAASGRGLGVVAADFDADGRTDLYVTNDGMENFLWMNEGGRFRDRAVLAGVAFNGEGVAEASMGVDADDVDNDGDLDLFMTHLTDESNTLYRNDGRGLFQDATAAHRLASPSFTVTGFGTAFLDVDNDGWLDLAVLNGAVKKIERLERAGDAYPLHEPNHLYRNQRDGTFEVIAAADAGSAFARSEVSRGLAAGDVDNDGDADVLLTNNSGPARLLINQAGQDRAWIGLRLRGPDAAPRDALGAVVTVIAPDGTRRQRHARTDGSYASARDPRVLVGLGDLGTPVRVEVRWPSGRRDAWEAVPINRYTTLVEGTGNAVPPAL